MGGAEEDALEQLAHSPAHLGLDAIRAQHQGARKLLVGPKLTIGPFCR